MSAEQRFRCLELFYKKYYVSKNRFFFSKIDTLTANAYKIYQYLPVQLFFLVLFGPEDEGHIILQIADN